MRFWNAPTSSRAEVGQARYGAARAPYRCGDHALTDTVEAVPVAVISVP